MNPWWVVPAAGLGHRFGGGLPKQYRSLAGKPLIVHTLERLLEAGAEGIALVLSAGDCHWEQLEMASHPRVHRVEGGAGRADSVRAGLQFLHARLSREDWVLVHDVARPCITAADIHTLVQTLAEDPVGGILAAPLSDTVKRTDAAGRIQRSEDRRHLWAAMTPQMFRYGTLCEALNRASQAGVAVTDESSALELMELSPKVVQGRRDNIKITHQEDMAIAAAIMELQSREPR